MGTRRDTGNKGVTGKMGVTAKGQPIAPAALHLVLSYVIY
jgi:hypothetical protein